ncbi:hypothetical protein CAPTEDRAFT_211621 [Capitella teleta]|uniref:Uncharacterized protein n=1 Tax=Capitella teleta TaxID=283909 RepID=R7UG71_CAPTE|nr:hypothetical protein CAPTEDRAFT_211621 [Capitella teleta]|eukprot:ELU05210.1 hypothetical protein CAPTEDRAFT_211621 [Capitella teleta]
MALRFPHVKQRTFIEDLRLPCDSLRLRFHQDPLSSRDVDLAITLRDAIGCAQGLEIPYYSSGVFPVVCCHCGQPDDLITGEASRGLYPTCEKCVTKPVYRRKRKAP